MDIGRRNIGLNYYDGKWTARLWAPGASQVLLKPERSDEPIQLMLMEHGYWWVETDQLMEGDQYWFVVDDSDPLPDPASLSQPEGVHGPSQALILSIESTTQSTNEWNNIELKDYIIYELHTGTFSDQGDFDGITARLDHLINLGITAIELMPV
ncbi:MAG: malto-oligosyltrehalose trehalohydrolase, partial [Pedobacter sp.]